MSENEQRCGLCKWFTKHEHSEKFGNCDFEVVLPECAFAVERLSMNVDEGGGCRCFERKEPQA